MFCLKKKVKTKSASLALLKLKDDLKKRSNGKAFVKKDHLSSEESKLLNQIRIQTNIKNENNITRTKAYFDIYSFHPEIHWSFLGHMVSRNGGWNMTDLKGEFFSKLLNKQEQIDFFGFLERGNWLIFQDVYPQFLLYKESLKRNRNLFYLLSFLNVSEFMEAVWNNFWKYRDSYVLAIALIINEQSYLEKRVIQNEIFHKNVFEKIEFKLQDILSLNHILFPFYNANLSHPLIGQTLHRFDSLHERILLGKRLYAVLFHPENLKNIFKWSKINPHTGSRKDYWPHLFNDINEDNPSRIPKLKIKNCRLRKDATRIYSPSLQYAWPNASHKKAETGDWFHDWKIIRYFDDIGKVSGEVEDDYCETLKKIELAAFAKETFF
ncbi:DUF2515 family protein [Pseudalkalibacillus caeni]|uniref:DUF2515 domain-containing protein n=1 Tax=Exobacillus caeni TaxID=2574798 RepID=A0A5R9EW72_9BACL|nr:DUF2515 family protein [Pseudalkalibacillus caeni]TLS35051.1 DUF2515 domain-containing protein [Pseudalkalibacillus caeni]